jgi:hypothetical protein
LEVGILTVVSAHLLLERALPLLLIGVPTVTHVVREAIGEALTVLLHTLEDGFIPSVLVRCFGVLGAGTEVGILILPRQVIMLYLSVDGTVAVDATHDGESNGMMKGELDTMDEQRLPTGTLDLLQLFHEGIFEISEKCMGAVITHLIPSFFHDGPDLVDGLT